MSLYTLFLCFLSLSSCGLFQHIGDSNDADLMKEAEYSIEQLSGRYWKLVEVEGKPVSKEGGNNGKEAHIKFLEDNRVSGTGGCNSFFGSFELGEHRRIRFNQIGATQMACVNMEIDAAIYRVLEKTDNFSLNEDTLTLNRAKMAPLAKFIAVDKKEENVLNGDWELNYISGPRITFEGLYPNKKPTLTISLPDTMASGSGSCNRFRTAISIDGNNIRFGEVASTRMYCEGDGEMVYFTTLKKINQYALSNDNNTLTLIIDDIAIMRFNRI